MRLFGGVAAVRRHHLGGDAVRRQLRCGYWAAAPRLLGITLAVMRLFAAVIGGGGIQPERLNAEGEARVLVAGGGALA